MFSPDRSSELDTHKSNCLISISLLMLHRHLKQETLVFFFQAFYSSSFLNLNYGTTNPCNCLNQKSRGYTWHLPDIQRSVNLQNIFCLSTSFHPQGHHPTPSHHHLSPKALPWTSNGFSVSILVQSPANRQQYSWNVNVIISLPCVNPFNDLPLLLESRPTISAWPMRLSMTSLLPVSLNSLNTA